MFRVAQPPGLGNLLSPMPTRGAGAGAGHVMELPAWHPSARPEAPSAPEVPKFVSNLVARAHKLSEAVGKVTNPQFEVRAGTTPININFHLDPHTPGVTIQARFP